MTKEVVRKTIGKKKVEPLKLCKFYWDCGRMGDVEGIFVACDRQIENALGKRIYFGEILGKHSEIYGDLNKEDLTILTEDQDFIKKAVEYGILPTGFNPLDYLSEDDPIQEEEDEE